MDDLLLERFKQAYSDMLKMDISRLDAIYADDVNFRDPIRRVSGLVALQDYFADALSNVAECRFEFLDQLTSDQSAYFKWNMHFCHPRLAGGARLVVRGMSQIQFNERIYFHEDTYDLGQMLYEHVPLVGGVTSWLKSRLAS